MKVYLAEKRQQGETIAAFLDSSCRTDSNDKSITSYTLANGDVVTWCRGHLYELARPDYYDKKYSNWQKEDLPIIPQNWLLLPKDSALFNLRAVNKLLNSADEVVLCTDYDREGQYLGMNAVFEAGFRGRVSRAKITVLDKDKLKIAFDTIEPVSKTMPL